MVIHYEEFEANAAADIIIAQSKVIEMKEIDEWQAIVCWYDTLVIRMSMADGDIFYLYIPTLVNAVIFLAPVSSFDEWLAEDPNVNRLVSVTRRLLASGF